VAGVDVVAVYGGDGTVMEAVGGLVGTEVPLAISPGGRANVLAVDPPQTVQIDGEIRGKAPLHVRVRPQAARIIVPVDPAWR
jgi:diacylglycerol kinase family enzyme